MSAIRVLVICDGLLNFRADDRRNSLAHLVETLKGFSVDGLTLEVESCSRNPDLAANGMPDPVFSKLQEFHQLWIFGYLGSEAGDPAIIEADAERLFCFMRDGGSIFATGDHGSLGASMGSRIKRVRQLRKWDACNAQVSGDSRIHTSLPVSGGVLADEFDQVAKPIFPHVARNGNSAVHFLMRHASDRVLRWLPDHAHEGCLERDCLEDFGGDVAAVETVAWAMAWKQAGHAPQDRLHAPRAVPIVSCFNPSLLPNPTEAFGAVVVDSTFHHWLDGNVLPLKEADDQRAYQHWQSYVLNIVTFLIPAKCLRDCAASLIAALGKQIEVRQLRPTTSQCVEKATFEGLLDEALLRVLPRQLLMHRVLLRDQCVSSNRELCRKVASVLVQSDVTT